MERTRIVHYTHSPTPVVISPSSIKPRLSSSSSLSSLVSCVDEKAPLASIDPENPSRRSSKSSDRSSRSSSTGRLFDNAKLRTSVYTAVRCQDYPVQPSTPTLRRERDGNGRGERPSSTLPVNGKPPIAAHDENRRHTLGSWSRSRRKPQNESLGSSFNRKGSSTLPRKPENLDTVSSSTLVKPRRRYTWLSPKQVAPQASTSPAPLREHNINGDVEKRQQSPRVSEIVTGNLRTSPVSPASTPGSPRLNFANYGSKPGSPNLHLSKPDSIPGSPKFNLSHPASVPGSPKLNLSKPVSIPGSPRLSLSDRVSTTGSSRLNSRPQADEYDWKKDPRRKPCHIQDAFDISPPSRPPQTESISKLGPNGASFHANGSTNSDTGYSSSSTSEKPLLNNIYNPKTNPEDHYSKSSVREEPNSGSRNIFSHSPNLSIRSVADDSFQVFDDKTPVKDVSQNEYAQLFPSSTTTEPSSPVTPTASNNSSIDTLFPEDKNDEHYLPHREIDSNGIKYSWSKVGKDTFILSRKGSDASQPSRKSSASGKHSSSSSGSSPNVANDTTTCFSSPRNRRSFRMAVGRYDSWCDVTPHGGSISNFLDNGRSFSRGSEGSDTVFPMQESILSRGEDKSKEDDIFVSCNDLISSKCEDNRHNGAVDVSSTVKSHPFPSVSNGTEVEANQNGTVCDQNDSPSRIKRNSMRLATASLSDLTCTFEDIDIGENTTLTNQESNKKAQTDSKMSNTVSSSPLSIRTNLSRTGSVLSTQNSSSFGSYYSCQSAGVPSNKNSPVSNASRRNELRAKLDSPSIKIHGGTATGSVAVDKNSANPLFARLTTSRASSPAVSTTSSSRSSHRQRPVYYWTRQAPYPRLLFSSCISAASSKASSDCAPPSPQTSTKSSIYSNSSYSHNHPGNVKTIPYFTKDKQQQSRINNTNSRHVPIPSRQQEPKSSSSRPITLPLQYTHYTPRESQFYDYNNAYFTSDLTPTSILESPNSEAIRSPPSLGRPKRKQYAGFDSQPLPMDSFMSDSSSVYTGVSCSSRNTDMTGQPDNGQFDESFVSEDVQSNFDGESRTDFSFDGSESFTSHHEIHDASQEKAESDSKRSSIHSTSTTKGQSDTSLNGEKEQENGGFQDKSFDDFIENSNDCINSKYSKFGHQFGPEYDAIFRLYKSDDVIRQDDLFTPPPAYRLWSENGKALSSSCLLRSKFYSKRKFLSTRDIFDLMRNSDRAGLDATVSLSSLEQHAHKVCEAILRCDEMGQGRQRHSLV